MDVFQYCTVVEMQYVALLAALGILLIAFLAHDFDVNDLKLYIAKP